MNELTSKEMIEIALRASPLVSGARVVSDGYGDACLYVRLYEDDQHLIMEVISDVQSEINDRLPSHRRVYVRLDMLRE